MASRITKQGLRMVLLRMIGNIHTNSVDLPFSLFLRREDERVIEVFLRKAYHRNDDEHRYEVVVRWDVEIDVDEYAGEVDPYVRAMNRYFGNNISCVTLEIITDDLKDLTQKDAIPEIFRMVNKLLKLEFCACEFGMIEQGDAVCFTCLVGLEQEDLSKHMCGVCHDTCNAPIEKTKCCTQWIHKHCSKKCGIRCPFCRVYHVEE